MKAVIVVVALLSSVAWAQDVSQARSLFVSGSKHFDLGEYEQALADFKEAYRIKDDPVLLYNIAQCQRLLKHDEEALRAYKTFLHRAPDSSVRPEVEQRIAALEQAIEAQKRATAMPPDRVLERPPASTPSPSAGAPAETSAAPAAPAEAVTATAPPPRRPVYKQWWLWTAVGAVAAVGLGVGLGVGLSSHGTSGNTLPAVTW